MELTLALKIVLEVLGFSVGIVLASLIGAIWLRLAALWLRFGDVPYPVAFKSALICNFVVATLNFSVGFSYGYTSGMFAQMHPRPGDLNFTYAASYTPIYFLYATVLGLLVAAAIFCRTIPGNDNESRIKFSDSIALASLYFALSFAFLMFLALVAIYVLSIFSAAGAGGWFGK